jgi:hypothetical protein
MDRKQLEQWLAEEASGRDEAADAAFAHLFAAVPKVEPNPAFVEQAVTAAWRWRARRRRLVACAWAATILLVAVGVGIALLGAPRIATSVIKGFAFVSGRAVPWLVAYTTVAMSWWWTLGHVGGVIASALVTPGRVVALVGVELVGLLAFYALQRIAGAERFGDAQV